MTDERMSGGDNNESVEDSDTLEILMSILMLSAQKPDGITKDEILTVLATYGQTALYELCADQEMHEEDEDEDEPERELEPPDIGTPTGVPQGHIKPE